jgi:hypothetical protein
MRLASVSEFCHYENGTWEWRNGSAISRFSQSTHGRTKLPSTPWNLNRFHVTQGIPLWSPFDDILAHSLAALEGSLPVVGFALVKPFSSI